jgi:hypothetical protein
MHACCHTEGIAEHRHECVRLLLAAGADVRPVGEVRDYAEEPRGESAIDLARGDGFWVPRREELVTELTRHVALLRWGRVRRLGACVGKLVLFMEQLYADVHFRPHNAGALEAGRHFEALCLAEPPGPAVELASSTGAR